MTRFIRASGCLASLLTLQACDEPYHTTQVQEGCYYDQAGVPIFKVSGKRAHFLIPTNVESVELVWISNDDEHYIRAQPAFYYDEPPGRIEKNTAMSSIRLPIIESGYPIIGIPYSPEGDKAVTLGRTCPATKQPKARS